MKKMSENCSVCQQNVAQESVAMLFIRFVDTSMDKAINVLITGSISGE